MAHDKANDERLVVLAHELRSPLAALANAARMLEQLGSNDPAVKRVGELVGRQARRMHALVEELLDLGRLDSERLALNRRRLDVRDIVQQVVADHQWLLADAGLRCELALDRSPVLVLGDAEKLAQVFTNVLGNAIKFTPPPGSISISVGTNGGAWAEIGVRDTGVGLRPDELFKIFGRFHQASRGRHGGLGLGLPIAKGIADLHGGEIRAASDGPGKGCTITVRLPLTDSNESTDEP